MKLKVKDIKIPPLRVNSEFDEETNKAFHESIEQLGIIQNPLVRKTKDGWELVDGYHRIVGLNPDQEVEVTEIKADDVTSLLYNVVTAQLKGKPNRNQLLMALAKLGADGYDLKTLSTLTGMKYQALAYLKETLNWTDYARTVAVENKYPIRLVRTIMQSELTDTRKDQILRLAIENNWNLDGVKAALTHPDAIVRGEKQIPKLRATDKTVCGRCEKVIPRKGAKFCYLCEECFNLLTNEGESE
jgi:hypothetical protein